jgi:diguanylate cyclase (GGDEF)-like protein
LAEERDPNETTTMNEHPQAPEVTRASDASQAYETALPDRGVAPAPDVTMAYETEATPEVAPTPEPTTSAETAVPGETAATEAQAATPAPPPTPSGYRPPAPSGWSDPLTGTDGPRLWDRVIASESARVRRYQRPATVALVEIVGMDGFTRVWGAEIAERTFVRIARTLAVEIRSSDHIARVDALRFAVLLTETDEIAAINFVERARAACERQPGELRIAIGWASPTAETDLVSALTVAEQRLAEELADPTPTDADPA